MTVKGNQTIRNNKSPIDNRKREMPTTEKILDISINERMKILNKKIFNQKGFRNHKLLAVNIDKERNIVVD